HFFFQEEDGIRDFHVTGVQTCALPICRFWQSTAQNTSESKMEYRKLTAYPVWKFLPRLHLFWFPNLRYNWFPSPASGFSANILVRNELRFRTIYQISIRFFLPEPDYLAGKSSFHLPLWHY